MWWISSKSGSSFQPPRTLVLFTVRHGVLTGNIWPQVDKMIWCVECKGVVDIGTRKSSGRRKGQKFINQSQPSHSTLICFFPPVTLLSPPYVLLENQVTIWSCRDRDIVARAQGHSSWVTAVAFDPYFKGYVEIGSEVYMYIRPYVYTYLCMYVCMYVYVYMIYVCRESTKDCA